MNTQPYKMPKTDMVPGLIAGLLSGLLLIPVLGAAMPEFTENHLWLSLLPAAILAGMVPLGLAVAYRIGGKIALLWQFAKFAVTGGLSALMDLGFLAIQIHAAHSLLGVGPERILFDPGIAIPLYSVFKAASFTVANTNSYYWNKFWTFSDRITRVTIYNYFIFFVVSIVGFAINVATATYVFHFIQPVLHWNPAQWSLVGGIAGSIAGMAWNFLGYRLLVFKKPLPASAARGQRGPSNPAALRSNFPSS